MIAFNFKNLKLAQLIVLIAIFLSGCGIKGTTNGSCTTGTAQITVFDSTISRDCGCSEGSGTFSPSTPFQCTLKVSTRLYINYNTSQYHYLNFGVSSGVTPQSYTPGTDSTTGGVTFTGTSPAGGFNFADSAGPSGVFIITN